MKIEEYIETLTDQIRCKKARASVACEIKNHILDQAQAYEQEGTTHEEALEQAVREMGDPMAAGAALDRVHRPQIDWHMLVMTLVFSIAGFLIMAAMGSIPDIPGSFERQLFYTLLSFGVIALVFFADYRFIGRYGIGLYLIMTSIFFIYAKIAMRVNGRIPGLNTITYLYIPVLAGILYRLRGQRSSGIIKALFFILFTAFISIQFSSSIFVGANIGAISMILLLFAIIKGWFEVNKKKTLKMIALGFIGFFSVSILTILRSQHSFRWARLMAFLHPYEYSDTRGYPYILIREQLLNAKIMGTYNNENTLSFVTNNLELTLLKIVFTYGILIGIVVIVAFLCLCIHSYKVVQAQKNQLGMMLSTACLITITFICIEGVLMNFGLYPITTIQFPFLSYGASATLTYAVLIGLLMSCHHYEKVITDFETPSKPTWHLDIKVEKR